ncbi:MAG TPA: mandelate racemase/muconate lactonizing enzyme family protein, partial [Chloroflexota bacterium]|nr:mandelate racemase/muconate lactonizing enzyme family protein [Chloroflexota bacterium]
MKISAIECFPVYNGARNNLFVAVDTDEGVSGVGESGLSGRELAVMGAIEHFKPQLIGQDAGRIEFLWQTLFRGGFFPANRVLCSAISAIDIALWDILGKRLDVPIFQLLGGRARDKVVCYPHAQVPGEMDDVAGLVENCQQFVAEGWKFVRWGLPQQAGDILEPRQSVATAIKQLR